MLFETYNTYGRNSDKPKKFPIQIRDPITNILLSRIKYLGRGSFGTCFIFQQNGRKKSYACKIVRKHRLNSKTHWHTIKGEVIIHSCLSHKNIVQFYRVFEDRNFIYTLQELCLNGTLSDLLRKRKCLTIVETKYYVRQIIFGVNYLHQKCIVHGDLKLSNVFLNEKMCVKIGDFGLADTVEGDKVLQVAWGTPNYMAPEIVERRGRSYKVDIWAVGCIIYYLIVGKPPFQGYDDLSTFERIRRCEVSVYEPGLRKSVSRCILKILQKDPYSRPSADDLLRSEFFCKGFIPRVLPPTCLYYPPEPQTLSVGRTAIHRYSSRIKSQNNYARIGIKRAALGSRWKRFFPSNNALISTSQSVR